MIRHDEDSAVPGVLADDPDPGLELGSLRIVSDGSGGGVNQRRRGHRHQADAATTR